MNWEVASRDPQPIGQSQPDRLYRLVELRTCRRYGYPGDAEHDFTLRTGRCGGPRRRNLDRARTGGTASRPACA